MRLRSAWFYSPLFMLAVLPRVAFAHAGHDHADGGFASGVMHPLTGFDHLIAMLAIGLWAAQIGGRAVVVLPCVFVIAMLAGGVIASQGVEVPLIEPGIITSLLVLGLLIATTVKLPLTAGVLITAVFAFMHGSAHGGELGDASPMAFALGALLATTCLHVAGVLLGRAMQAGQGGLALRVTGGAIAALGLLLALGVW